jgi:hypothetical protein
MRNLFQVSVTLRELGLDHPEGYHITDLYDDYDYGIVTPERRFKVDVNPSGSEFTLKEEKFEIRLGDVIKLLRKKYLRKEKQLEQAKIIVTIYYLPL